MRSRRRMQASAIIRATGRPRAVTTIVPLLLTSRTHFARTRSAWTSVHVFRCGDEFNRDVSLFLPGRPWADSDVHVHI